MRERIEYGSFCTLLHNKQMAKLAKPFQLWLYATKPVCLLWMFIYFILESWFPTKSNKSWAELIILAMLNKQAEKRMK